MTSEGPRHANQDPAASAPDDAEAPFGGARGSATVPTTRGSASVPTPPGPPKAYEPRPYVPQQASRPGSGRATGLAQVPDAALLPAHQLPPLPLPVPRVYGRPSATPVSGQPMSGPPAPGPAAAERAGFGGSSAGPTASGPHGPGHARFGGTPADPAAMGHAGVGGTQSGPPATGYAGVSGTPAGPSAVGYAGGPATSGPATSGPPASGPPAIGHAGVSGPPMAGPPAMTDPPAMGHARVGGPPASGPPSYGPPTSGPPAYGPPAMTGHATGQATVPGSPAAAYADLMGPAPAIPSQYSPGHPGSPPPHQPFQVPEWHAEDDHTPQTDTSGSHTGLLIAVGAVVLIAVVGLVAFLWPRGDGTAGFAVNTCVRQSGTTAIAADCGESGAFTIVARVTNKDQCPDTLQPWVELSTGDQRILCLAPTNTGGAPASNTPAPGST